MNRARLIPGLILIVLGIVFMLMQYFEFGPGLFLILLGFVFFIPYALTRSYGLLIPGCILAGLGIGMVFERGTQTDITAPLGLGVGFIAIYVIHLIVARASHWWPLIPGVVLLLVGITAGIPQAQTLLVKGGIPLMLIVIGLAILAGQFVFRPGAKRDA
ncbi:MAG: hypothetical protein HY868_20450 [Chloroflexi bacterium]|nr:hypothetical protein [Chloroflexota bacterium]